MDDFLATQASRKVPGSPPASFELKEEEKPDKPTKLFVYASFLLLKIRNGFPAQSMQGC